MEEEEKKKKKLRNSGERYWRTSRIVGIRVQKDEWRVVLKTERRIC